MTRRKVMRAGDYLMLFAWLVGMLYAGGTYGIRASYWFDVRTVFIHDAVQGEPLLMDVDRDVNREFQGSYVVVIRRVGSQEIVCEASGATPYTPQSTLPDPLTMEWWAWKDKRCYGANMPTGTFVATTVWTIENPFGILPNKTLTAKSNPFTITPQKGDEVDNLSRKIDELQKKLDAQQQIAD